MFGRLFNKMANGIVNYQANQAPSSEQIKDQILHSPNAVIKVHFPTPAGDVYFVRPERQHEQALNNLINGLDQLQEGRKPYQALDYLTSGPSIVTLGGETGMVLHHRITQCLTRPADLIGAVLQIQARFFSEDALLNIVEITKWPMMHVISHALLGTNDLNVNLVDAITSYDVLEKGSKDLSKKIFFQLLGAGNKEGMKFLNGGPEARESYQQAAKRILKDLQPVVSNQLELYLNDKLDQKNIVTLSIISLVQDRFKQQGLQGSLLHDVVKDEIKKLTLHPELLEELMLDPYLTTLPAVVQPGVNIANICQCALLQLCSDEQLYHDLIQYIADNGITENSTQEELKIFFEKDERADGLLNAIYLESLRLGIPAREVNDNTPFDFFTWRYTLNKISYAGCEIPAKSVLAIADALPRFDEKQYPDPFKFNVYRFCYASAAKENKQDAIKRFGMFNRHCPAKKISQYLFKAYVVGLLTKFNISLADQNYIRLKRL